MIRSTSPAISEISVGSPSPPPTVPQLPSSHSYAFNMKRHRNNAANLLFASPCHILPPPTRRKSAAERIKSFSIADILGKGEKVLETPCSSTQESNTPPALLLNENSVNKVPAICRPPTTVAVSVSISASTSTLTSTATGAALPRPTLARPPALNIPSSLPLMNNAIIAENLVPHVVGPTLIMLDLPGLSKVPISNTWDMSTQMPLNTLNSINTMGPPHGAPLAIHPFFPPALLHYEQRLAWDYQRQLQEHFHTQAQLLRQMSMDPNIIPSEDGSERSHSSSGGVSPCYSPEVNVASDSYTDNNSISINDDNNGDSDENIDSRERRISNCEIYKCDKDIRNKINKNERNIKELNDTPLDALFQLSTKNFDEDQDPTALSIFAARPNPKKKRKSRTAFTNHQIFELEKRFLYQKYLSPADRDEIAASLGLSNAQVITWFQNRRAKLKRDMEELKKDVESVKQLSAHKSFLENVNDLSILKTRPVSRHHHHQQPQQRQHHQQQELTEIHGTISQAHGQLSHLYRATTETTMGICIPETQLHQSTDTITITCNKTSQCDDSSSSENGDYNNSSKNRRRRRSRSRSGSRSRSRNESGRRCRRRSINVSTNGENIINHVSFDETTTTTTTTTETGTARTTETAAAATAISNISQLEQQQEQQYNQRQSQQSNRHHSQSNSSRG